MRRKGQYWTFGGPVRKQWPLTFGLWRPGAAYGGRIGVLDWQLSRLPAPLLQTYRRISPHLPPELRRVAWPAEVLPLGTFESIGPTEFTLATVLLRASPDQLEAVYQALAAEFASVADLGYAGLFQSHSFSFRLNDRLIMQLSLTPDDEFLCIDFFKADWYSRFQDRQKLLSLSSPPQAPWDLVIGGSEVIFLPDADLHAAFAHWQAEARAQGYWASEALIGNDTAVLRLENPQQPHFCWMIVARLSAPQGVWRVFGTTYSLPEEQS